MNQTDVALDDANVFLVFDAFKIGQRFNKRRHSGFVLVGFFVNVGQIIVDFSQTSAVISELSDFVSRKVIQF